jgi:protease IV
MKSVRKILKASLLLVAPSVFSAPWNGGVEVGTSVAHSYGSRSLFTNPAAMGFEKELNGSGLLSSFTFGETFNQQSEFSLSSTYSLFGVGFERLSSGSDTFSRYQFGVAYPLTQTLFLGTKLSTTSAEASALSGHFAWDLGLQLRPLSFLSLGLLASELNQPIVKGVKSPSIYTLGTTLRPLRWLTFTADAETPSNDWLKTFTYQTTVSVEPIKGIIFSSGFQSDHRFQMGFQIDLGKASLFSVVQPSPIDNVKGNSTQYTVGFQTSLKRQESFLREPQELLITLDESLTEEGREGNLFSKSKTSLLEILQGIKNASENSKIDKITVKLESFPLGLASAEEVAEQLLLAREKGKKVEVFLSSAKTKEYLIASSASTIFLEPSGEITLLGPRTSHYYAKGTLDKIGIEAELFAKGDYKSAPETFNRKESSAKSREASIHELKEIEKNLITLFQRTRKITSNDWKNWLQQALFSSEDALKFKLIDQVGSYSDVRNQGGYQAITSPSTQWADRSLSLPDRIAVITADGSILEKKNRFLSLSGQSQITPQALEPLFQQAIRDSRTRAIVFRVSSPGGEVIASEQIANLVAYAKSKKPVIVSMGDMAASGGYFISAPSDRIFADKFSLTGSIGVFLGKFNFASLYQKLELRKEILGLGPYPSLDSEHKAWTVEERAVMQRRLNQYYTSFVDFVAQARKIPLESAEKAAQGRVWLGSESVDLKIVDENGGLLRAIEEAQHRAGLTTHFVTYPIRESLSLFDTISEESLVGMANGDSLKSLLSLPDLQKELAQLYWFQDHPFLFLLPGNHSSN